MRQALFLLLTLTVLFNSNSRAEDKPKLQLANSYKEDTLLSEYVMSEKYDGIRAYWNGTELLSRGGHVINAPAELLSELPKTHLDGELWAGHQTFEQLSGLARRKSSRLKDWQQVKYMVFDAPLHRGMFIDRYKHLKVLEENFPSSFWQTIEQRPITSHQSLMQELEIIESKGGEGLMLRKARSFLTAGRNDDLLKVKSYHDAEGVVIGYKKGNGKYQGLLGSLKVKGDNGHIFYIGTGLTDQQRQEPPEIGSLITYKYFGLTQSGKPRFASFMRVKPVDE